MKNYGQYSAFGNQFNKIELVSCPRAGRNCSKQLSGINEDYVEYFYFYRRKDYQKSILALKNAFQKTLDLHDTTCIKCAELFRSTIIESLEKMCLELQEMSNGSIKTTHYQFYKMAEIALTEFKGVG
jgi:hypothetical protein